MSNKDQGRPDPTILNVEPHRLTPVFPEKKNKLEDAINNDGVISAASLPDEYQIKDPFDSEFLMSLPKEALVAVIQTFQEGFIKYVAAQRIKDIASREKP